MGLPSRGPRDHQDISHPNSSPGVSTFLRSRSQRLWAIIGILVILIYASNFFAVPFASWLRSEGLLSGLFIAAFLTTLFSLTALVRRAEVNRIEIGEILGIVAVFLFAIVRINLVEERSHLIEYSVLGAFIFEAIFPQAGNRSTVWHSAWKAALLTTFIGCLGEMIQVFLPSRVFDLRDILFNTAAAIGGVALISVISRARVKKRAL